MIGKPKFSNLPPLKSLRGFEATARLKSVNLAAQELSVTSPAITHQIHALEEHLGITLFDRSGRQMLLTHEGHSFYQHVIESLEILEKGSKHILSQKKSKPLYIQTYLTISVKWLAHRLQLFREKHQDIDLEIYCTSGWEFEKNNADIGLIYRTKPIASNQTWIKLFDANISPVCNPNLIPKQKQAITPADLLNYPLISVRNQEVFWNWEDWFRSAGLTQDLTDSSIVVDNLILALEMILSGEGIALVNGPTAYDDIQQGKLIKPVQHCLEIEGEWGLIYNNKLNDNTKAQHFIHWITQEADVMFI